MPDSGRELTNFSQNVNNSLTEFQDGIMISMQGTCQALRAPSALMIDWGKEVSGLYVQR